MRLWSAPEHTWKRLSSRLNVEDCALTVLPRPHGFWLTLAAVLGELGRSHACWIWCVTHLSALSVLTIGHSSFIFVKGQSWKPRACLHYCPHVVKTAVLSLLLRRLWWLSSGGATVFFFSLSSLTTQLCCRNMWFTSVPTGRGLTLLNRREWYLWLIRAINLCWQYYQILWEVTSVCACAHIFSCMKFSSCWSLKALMQTSTLAMAHTCKIKPNHHQFSQ